MATGDTGDPNYGGQGPTFDQVNADYLKWLGRPLSQQEFDTYYAGRPYDSGQVANSPEGLARANQDVPGTPEYTPQEPAPGNDTGQWPPPNQVIDNNPPLTPDNGPAPSPTPGPAPGPTPPPGQGPDKGPGILDPWVNQPMPPPKPTGGGNVPPPAPVFTPPIYTADKFTPPPAFTYKEFQAPDAFKAPVGDEVYQDPGYQFRADQGRKQLETSAAAKGVLRTGGTLKDIVNYGQDLASQEYGNVYNRRAQEYDRSYSNLFNEWRTGYDTAANTYSTNYGVSRDTFGLNVGEKQAEFDRNYAGKVAAYTPLLHEWDTNVATATHNSDEAWDRAWKEYLQKYEEFKRNQEWPYHVLTNERDAGTRTI